ncbi:Cytochrome P450 monooxygenase astJ [Paramyrothecium foliicola]|nr:Cytochrome P450 monooxygenase astJ [Paramyrothecium foliicola]
MGSLQIWLGEVDGTQAAIALLTLWVAYFLCRTVYRIWFHPLSKFKGPLLFSIFDFAYLWPNYIKGSWTRDVVELHKQYGPIIRTGPNRLALDGAVAWSDVYGHKKDGQPEFSKVPGNYHPEDEKSLINAPRADHHRMRKQVRPAFSEAAVMEKEPIIKESVDLLMRRLFEDAKRGPINMVKMLNFATFDIIGKVAYSETFECLEKNDYHPLVKAVCDSAQGLSLIQFLKYYPMLLYPVVLLGLSPAIRKQIQFLKGAREKAKARLKYGDMREDGQADITTHMLGLNHDGERGMADDEIVSSSILVIVGGSETLATALSAFFFFVSKNPEPYKLVTDEVRAAFSTADDITFRSIPSLAYLNACIEETLRLHPPAAEIPPRVSPGGMVGDTFIPAGTKLSISAWATFHNPTHFRDADSFRPERWLPKTHPRYDAAFDDDNRAAFKPFSHGPRDCVGKVLAYAEMRLILCRILHAFDFGIDKSEENWDTLQRSFLIWDKGPLNVTLRPRKEVFGFQMAQTLSSEYFAAIEAIERACSALSLAGSILIISTFLYSEAFRKPINRLVFYATFGNVFSNVGTMVSRSVIDLPASKECQVQAFLIQMFIPADAYWTLAMAINVYLRFYKRYDADQLRRLEWVYLLCCYGVPFVPALTYFLCWIAPDWDALRFVTFYGPVWVVILIIFLIYIRVGRTIYKKRGRISRLQRPQQFPNRLSRRRARKTTEVSVTREIAKEVGAPCTDAVDTVYPNQAARCMLSPSYTVTVSAEPYQPGASTDTACQDPSLATSLRASAEVAGHRPEIVLKPGAAGISSTKWAYTKCAILFFTAILVTWIPSSTNRFYSLVHDGKSSLALEFMSAFVLPLQGFWNAIIYIVTSWNAVSNLAGHLRQRHQAITREMGKRPITDDRTQGGFRRRVSSDHQMHDPIELTPVARGHETQRHST